MIPLTEVQSTAMKAFGYDPASKTFAIRYRVGRVFHYRDVSQETADAFAAAESKWKALPMIRKHEHTVVLDEPAEDDLAPFVTKSGATVRPAAPWPFPTRA